MRNNQKGFSEIILILVIVVLVGVVGFFIYQNNQLKQESDKPIISDVSESATETTTSPNATASPTKTSTPAADWKTYSVNEIGLTFKLPKSIDDSKVFEEAVRQGDTGSILCATFGASEIHVACGHELFALGTTSQDFSAARGGSYLDHRGFSSVNGNYYAKSLGTNNSKIPSELIQEITTSQGLTILRILGKNQTTGEYRGAVAGTPGEGNVGALVNFQGHPEFDGLAVFMTLSDSRTTELFDQILSTFEFTK